MFVEDIMTKNVMTIDCNETVFDACSKYREHQVGSLVVMDKNITVGIITERDIIERIILMNRDPEITKVKDIISTNLRTIHASAPIEKASDIMKEHNIKKLPVILNNEIVGIITETDLSRTINAFSKAIDELVEFYAESRDNIEKMMDDWGDMLIKLKGYKELTKGKETANIEI